ncbi:hypothetical protein Rta_17040 [Ramlibacter tataouinensis TTB310]|uniref:Exo-alpha-sialidase n=1 Tax=Ramlibacter tataouinensis (strain ATCC BAA-407 / DSM 14655 / LMG 21543 / TTB310) TaxID=365046 RepID=F5Y6A8_RAMTT|nr:hypothetical protein Rta_17040 [Ramlibacter tataouinensis TTB310]
MTTNPTGTVMAAAAIPGGVHVSTDSGATWTATTLDTGAIWISLDMTADGTRMIAVALNGAMVMSTDRGATWAPIDAAFNAGGSSISYESVTMSQDGTRIVAADLSGNLYVSADGTSATPTFTTVPVAGAAFRAVDSSADGSVVVAVSQNRDAHLSTNGGTTFAPLTVTVDGAAVTDNWYRVAVSPDGNTIVVAGNTDYAGPTSTGVYVSRDRGTTWVRGLAAAGTYTSLDTSQNGDIIVVTRSGAGEVLLSTNGGTSFAPITVPEGETNWRAAAITSDAGRLLLAAGTFFSQTGRVYLSSGSVVGE